MNFQKICHILGTFSRISSRNLSSQNGFEIIWQVLGQRRQNSFCGFFFCKANLNYDLKNLPNYLQNKMRSLIAGNLINLRLQEQDCVCISHFTLKCLLQDKKCTENA